LKTLAWALNLDQEILLSEYRRLSGNREDDPTRPLHPKEYVDTDIMDEGGSNWGLSMGLLVIIIVVGVLLYFLNPAFHRFVVEYLPFLEKSPAPVSQTAPVNPAVSQAPPAVTLPAQAGGRLILRAVKATWSQILVDDDALKFVYFQPGQSQSYESKKSISIMAGDGQALRAEWNGQDLGFLGPQGPLETIFPPTK
jgi:cytoskeletal protein RodZ